jgi:ribosome-binding factor A
MEKRKDRAANLVKELSAEFLERESNRVSLITVTDCRVSADLKKATVFFTVLPASREQAVLKFAKRKRSELRDFLKEKMRTQNVPFVDLAIDEGEKNRQKIDELLRHS